MIKFLVIVQIIFVVASSVAFVCTWIAAEKVKEESKDYIIVKTVKYMDASVDVAEELLHSPKASTFLAPHQIQVLKDEIQLYRDDTHGYVTSLVDEKKSVQAKEDDSEATVLQAALIKK